MAKRPRKPRTKAGDSVELFGVGFGPTNPAVAAGQAFSGAAPTTNPVQLSINNVSVTPTATVLSSAGLYQINLRIPPGLGAGDVSLQASVGGVRTPASVVICLQQSRDWLLRVSQGIAAHSSRWAEDTRARELSLF